MAGPGSHPVVGNPVVLGAGSLPFLVVGDNRQVAAGLVEDNHPGVGTAAARTALEGEHRHREVGLVDNLVEVVVVCWIDQPAILSSLFIYFCFYFIISNLKSTSKSS